MKVSLNFSFSIAEDSSPVESFSIAKLRQRKAEREAREAAQKAASIASMGGRVAKHEPGTV